MVFYRRWFLIFMLLLWGGNLFAATTREQRALTVAQQTFNDKIFDRAETELDQFVKSYPKSSNLPQATLLLAQSQFKQGKYAAALQSLAEQRETAGALADKFIYWTAEAQFATNGFAEAAENFSTVAKKFPESSVRLSAAIEAAAAWEKMGSWADISALLNDPAGAFQLAAPKNPSEELIITGRLLLGRALSAQKNFAESTDVLSALDPLTLTAEQQWKKNSLLFSNKMATGEKLAAMALTTNLLALAHAEKNSDWQADASAKRGAVLEAMELYTEAAASRRENLSTNAPVEKQREAILKIAALAAAQNDFAGAESALEKFLTTAADASVTQLVQLTLGELHLKDFAATNHLVPAQVQFDRLLNDAPDSPLAGKAFLDRGWVNWLAEKYEPALMDFKNAVARLPATNDLAVAVFKAADAEFVLKKFPAARDDYKLLLAKFADFPSVMRALGDRALAQIVRVNLELKDRAGTEAALRELLGKFPNTGVAETNLLLAAENFSDFSSPNAARDLLRQFVEKFPTSPLRPEAEFALARTFERERNWEAAATNHAAWLENFSTNSLAPSVAYAQAWANYQAGHETNAFLLFSNFLAQFPTNENAPLAQWWVADNLFRARNFLDAEKNYEVVHQTEAWKSSPLFYPAQLMAGRAAMGRFSYKDAEAHLLPLINDSNCPPELAMQARFTYGAVLKEMPSADTNNPLVNLTVATNIFDQIFRANPTNETGLRARGELAGCAKQLGDFTTATNVYLQVADSPYANAAMRAGAKVGLGLTYETMASTLPLEQRKPLLSLAKNAYLDVVDSPVKLDREEPAAEFWVKKAGLLALPLLNLDGQVHTNFYTRLEKLLPQLKETLDKKKAALGAAKN